MSLRSIGRGRTTGRAQGTSASVAPERLGPPGPRSKGKGSHELLTGHTETARSPGVSRGGRGCGWGRPKRVGGIGVVIRGRERATRGPTI